MADHTKGKHVASNMGKRVPAAKPTAEKASRAPKTKKQAEGSAIASMGEWFVDHSFVMVLGLTVLIIACLVGTFYITVLSNFAGDSAGFVYNQF